MNENENHDLTIAPVVAGLQAFATSVGNVTRSPEFHESLNSALSQVEQLRRRMSEVLGPVVENLAPVLADMTRLMATAGVIIRESVPENWLSVTPWPDIDVIETMLMEEGLALAWVPDSAIILELLDAQDAHSRRVVLDSHREAIALDCARQLALVTAEPLRESVAFAHEAVDAFHAGLPSAAQALSANLLDTLLRDHYDGARLRDLTGGKRPAADMDAYDFREAFVLAGIYGAYVSWWPSSSSTPPTSFSRHMSAHKVSTTQYNRLNALIGVMHVTALLRHLNRELAR